MVIRIVGDAGASTSRTFNVADLGDDVEGPVFFRVEKR
jgi:hypothetical protein